MEDMRTFYPPKRTGTILQLLLILLFSSGGGWGVWGISNVQVALQLLPYLVLIVLFLSTVPFLLYRLYALNRSEYTLERGGIHLQWGWRSENIPMNQIKWIHKAEDLEVPPRPPLFRWPGAVIGSRRLGRGPGVEFMASREKELVIIAVEDGYFAISPAEVDEFIQTYNSLTELGSLSMLTTQSSRPTLFLTDITSRKPVLWMFLGGAVLNISLLVWTLLVIPSQDRVSLGFSPIGIPHDPLESVRLIINSTAYLGNLILGLFLFRNEDNRGFAYILWGGSLFIGIIFHLGMGFILY